MKMRILRAQRGYDEEDHPHLIVVVVVVDRPAVVQKQQDKTPSSSTEDLSKPAHAPLHVKYGTGRVQDAHDWVALGGELAPHEEKRTPADIRRAWNQGKSLPGLYLPD